MIITKQKSLEDILKALGNEKSVFLVGCGDCATVCNTGSENAIKKLKEALEQAGKTVTGWAYPDAPCVAAQATLLFAKNRKAIEAADSFIVMGCGLGSQSIQENNRWGKSAHPANDTLFGGTLDKTGKELFEKCSACGECILDLTGGLCAVTRCAKGLLNGPCGGSNKGKCEVEKDRDCIWILIYNRLQETNKLDLMKVIQPPKDYSQAAKPRNLTLS